VPPIETLRQYEAIRFFTERARAAKAHFSLTNENALADAEICARLDGLPLAIELAAARIKLLSPQAMCSRISNPLKFLTGGARDLPERQRTLRGAIAWSHALLDEGEQVLFARGFQSSPMGVPCKLWRPSAISWATCSLMSWKASPLS
jgi:predicted ATPase